MKAHVEMSPVLTRGLDMKAGTGFRAVGVGFRVMTRL